MKVKNTITAILILIMVLQLLPVRQVIRYFFIDNLMVEEITDVNKKATKNFNLSEEDQNIHDDGFILHHYVLVNNSLSFQFCEVLPVNHAADIHTPPPNNFVL